MPYALDGNPSASEISDAINYVLANLNSGVPANAFPVSNNPTTGFISNTLGDIIQYQYRYLDVKYADRTTGLNFSDNPYSRLYFGLLNTDTATESTDPAQYVWFEVTGGFGLNNVLWTSVTGGRHATFAVSQNAPDTNQNWQVVPVQAIDLDNPFKTYEQYMTVKFATNSVGAGFTSSPTNATFYGIYTSADGSSSADPTEYAWSPFSFGTTFNLYYRSLGGRNISFIPSTYQPIGYIPYANLVINLDVPTAGAVNEIGIISQTPLIIQAPYRYLLVRYGTSSTGTGITNDPTGKTYFGLQASDVLTLDSNPADYTWFAAGGTFLTGVNLWSRTSASNIVQFSLTLDAPDTSGWYNVTADLTALDPYIDVLARSGTLVTDITSPADGRLGYSSIGVNGVINLNLDPYGQGRDTGGFSINPAAVSTIQFDQFGRVIQANALDEVRFSSMLTHATSGQTAFTFSNAQADQILVFRNGVFLKPATDFTRTSTTVTFTNACTLNDVVAIYYIRLIDGTTSADKVPFVYSSQTLTSGQTVIATTYPDGSEFLFLNGVMLVDTDYTYVGTNQGYILNTPSVGGSITIVSFSYNNGNVLIFGENYTETASGTTNVVFPTSFYRNSTLMFFNGCLLRPGTDYTVPGSASLSYNFTSVGFLSFTGQPVQFMTFNSSGEASASSLSSAGVLGYDFPVVIENPPTIMEMFKDMQKQINKLKKELKTLKGNK
jgi:hypothetical protein